MVLDSPEMGFLSEPDMLGKHATVSIICDGYLIKDIYVATVDY